MVDNVWRRAHYAREQEQEALPEIAALCHRICQLLSPLCAYKCGYLLRKRPMSFNLHIVLSENWNIGLGIDLNSTGLDPGLRLESLFLAVV